MNIAAIDLKFASEFGIIVSGLIALIGFILAARQYRSQMNVQLFLAFTERYMRVLDGFPPETRQSRVDPNVEPPPSTPEIHKAVLKYLNLCAEEYHLYQSGYLAKDIWVIWETKMKTALRGKLFRREWNELYHEFDDQPKFQEFVRSVHAEPLPVAPAATTAPAANPS
jgi:hypothetical protein